MSWGGGEKRQYHSRQFLAKISFFIFMLIPSLFLSYSFPQFFLKFISRLELVMSKFFLCSFDPLVESWLQRFSRLTTRGKCGKFALWSSEDASPLTRSNTIYFCTFLISLVASCKVINNCIDWHLWSATDVKVNPTVFYLFLLFSWPLSGHLSQCLLSHKYLL